ncbi:MAG: hypothetical protein A2128_01040 [Candidatus Liptonbacteria bacterium GWC1_60_9]|uniref:Uncharacterized protein n=2 Tax=Candidatus Liptoniibacteriota TaxID=1817909 RepID=A0A1G2CAJ5_9BACT|nr:MAG: hypothetical protein A2128_01040 [Candidatus Liptonbacteria bacterium GWC1_60_9]OGY98181.1 MAG: hypothetical protein A3E09_00045 [Candidatus Liptonbacteria bacterium RIFCSPHIGHO2_12_FULL_60_13]HLB32124.1 hypothetical protein [Patescibacteria group bacterium]
MDQSQLNPQSNSNQLGQKTLAYLTIGFGVAIGALGGWLLYYFTVFSESAVRAVVLMAVGGLVGGYIVSIIIRDELRNPSRFDRKEFRRGLLWGFMPQTLLFTLSALLALIGLSFGLDLFSSVIIPAILALPFLIFPFVFGIIRAFKRRSHATGLLWGGILGIIFFVGWLWFMFGWLAAISR